jgi:hypothetical protein
MPRVGGQSRVVGEGALETLGIRYPGAAQALLQVIGEGGEGHGVLLSGRRLYNTMPGAGKTVDRTQVGFEKRKKRAFPPGRSEHEHLECSIKPPPGEYFPPAAPEISTLSSC